MRFSRTQIQSKQIMYCCQFNCTTIFILDNVSKRNCTIVVEWLLFFVVKRYGDRVDEGEGQYISYKFLSTYETDVQPSMMCMKDFKI